MKPAARPQRGQRVADQIQRDLAQMIQRELPSSRAGLITLTGVDLTPDYAHAKVYFTVLGKDAASTTQVLNDKAGYFHSVLFKQLSIHTVPRLVFVHDASVEKGFEIDRLIAAAVATSVSAAVVKDPADEVIDGAVYRVGDTDLADDSAEGARALTDDGAPAADLKPATRAARKRKA